MMRRRAMCLCFFSFCFFCSAEFLGQSSWAGNEEIYTCREPEFGVKFLCSPDWTVHFDDRADMFVIEEDPEVILMIARETTGLISIEQLTHDWLSKSGNYADGFDIERLKVDGFDAVKVKAYDKQDNDIRLTDVYIIRGGHLYKILFSVAPKTEWEKYQFLFEKVLTSLLFFSTQE